MRILTTTAYHLDRSEPLSHSAEVQASQEQFFINSDVYWVEEIEEKEAGNSETVFFLFSVGGTFKSLAEDGGATCTSDGATSGKNKYLVGADKCDQTGAQFSYKSSPNIWLHFGLFWKSLLFKKKLQWILYISIPDRTVVKSFMTAGSAMIVSLWRQSCIGSLTIGPQCQQFSSDSAMSTNP